jgi:hypothetical protein
MAAKLARLVYHMLRDGMQFVDRGAQFYEAQHRNLQIKSLSNGKPPPSDSTSSRPQQRSREFLESADHPCGVVI